MTTRTIEGTDYTVTSTTSLDSIANPTGPKPYYASFQLWLSDVDRLCLACLNHGALHYRSEERFQEAYATGISPKEMYWYIYGQLEAEAEARNSN